MDKKKATAVIQQYDALIERAAKIVTDAPFWDNAIKDRQEYARISIIGDDEVALTWPYAEGGGYDEGCYIENKVARFSAKLLFISDDELAAWKKEQTRLYEQQRRQHEDAAKQKREAHERSVLAALKQKYETKTS